MHAMALMLVLADEDLTVMKLFKNKTYFVMKDNKVLGRD